MATTAKLEIEDLSWDSSRSSSVEIQLTRQQARRRGKDSSRGRSTSRTREVAKKPVPPTPPSELSCDVQLKVTMSKESLELLRDATNKHPAAPKSKAATSSEMVMRAAWQQYYSEYDRYKEEMAVWEDVQRKMRKQLARFLSGPSKPPAPPPGVQPKMGASSKTALALPASSEQASTGTNPQADEGMHIRIGLPGRMVKRRGSRSFSAGRPLEEAPPCVQAMYAHPGPFGPPGPFGSQPSFGGPQPFGPPPLPFAGPGGPFRGVGFPRPPPMLMARQHQQFGPPGPFTPQQPPLPFAGMRPPRRSTSRITLNFM